MPQSTEGSGVSPAAALNQTRRDHTAQFPVLSLGLPSFPLGHLGIRVLLIFIERLLVAVHLNSDSDLVIRKRRPVSSLRSPSKTHKQRYDKLVGKVCVLSFLSSKGQIFISFPLCGTKHQILVSLSLPLSYIVSPRGVFSYMCSRLAWYSLCTLRMTLN